MKNPLIYTYIALAVVFCTSALAHAETTKAATVEAATQEQSTTPAPEKPIAELTLSQRKAFAEKNLTTIYTQFALFVTRTQLTTDRLSQKGIDTTKAKEELTLATTALKKKKKGLDTLAAIKVTDDQKDTTELKKVLESIETGLKETRAHLIESLVALKTAVGNTNEPTQ